VVQRRDPGDLAPEQRSELRVKRVTGAEDLDGDLVPLAGPMKDAAEMY
jgi:hypothetical protein